MLRYSKINWTVRATFATYLAVCASALANERHPMPVLNTASSPYKTETGTLQVPKGYEFLAKRTVHIDGSPAVMSRYERRDGHNTGLGGEHFSYLLTENSTLKGLARMDAKLLHGDLPSTRQAKEIALQFLRAAAPDLLENFQISWIKPHDEDIRVSSGGIAQLGTLTGMKVKMRNLNDGKWFWVIVGTDKQVMFFERDIIWITMPGHRQTEKWLHDSWLAQNGGLNARTTATR